MKKGLLALVAVVMAICFCACGKSACEHKFTEIIKEDSTCSAVGKIVLKCDLCDLEKTETIEKKSHNFDEGKVTAAATCAATGTKIYTCSSCGEEKTEAIEKTSHNYGNGKVTVAATCKATGTKTYTCSSCGEEKT